MTTCRFIFVLIMGSLVSACTSLPHCYSTTEARAAKYHTKSCPAWMCDAGGSNSVCVTRTGDGKRIVSPTRVKAEPVEEAAMVIAEPVSAPEPVEMPEPLVEPEPVVTAYVPEPAPPGNLDEAPAGTFVLQVVALSFKSRAEQFIVDRQLDDAEVIAVESAGSKVHAVVTGYYSTREEATEAADAFAASHDGLTPWVRRVEEMRESRERLDVD